MCHPPPWTGWSTCRKDSTEHPMLLETTPAQMDVDVARPRGALRRIFSFPLVLAALLTVLTVLTVRGRFSDPDMWWHLKTGEIIWNAHSIPRLDVFSYTAAGHAWTAQ